MKTRQGFVSRGILMAIIFGFLVAGGGAYYVFQQNLPSPIDLQNADSVLQTTETPEKQTTSTVMVDTTLSTGECTALYEQSNLDALRGTTDTFNQYATIQETVYFFNAHVDYGSKQIKDIFCRKLTADASTFKSGDAFYGTNTNWARGMGRDTSALWIAGYRLPISGRNFKVYTSDKEVESSGIEGPAYLSTDTGVYFVPDLVGLYPENLVSATEGDLVGMVQRSKLEEANPVTFKVIAAAVGDPSLEVEAKSAYATDGKKVYFNRFAIDANPTTFSVIKRQDPQGNQPAIFYGLGIDGNNLYLQDKKVVLINGLREIFSSTVLDEEGTPTGNAYILFSDGGGNYYRVGVNHFRFVGRGVSLDTQSLAEISAQEYKSYEKTEMLKI